MEMFEFLIGKGGEVQPSENVGMFVAMVTLSFDVT